MLAVLEEVRSGTDNEYRPLFSLKIRRGLSLFIDTRPSAESFKKLKIKLSIRRMLWRRGFVPRKTSADQRRKMQAKHRMIWPLWIDSISEN